MKYEKQIRNVNIQLTISEYTNNKYLIIQQGAKSIVVQVDNTDFQLIADEMKIKIHQSIMNKKEQINNI